MLSLTEFLETPEVSNGESYKATDSYIAQLEDELSFPKGSALEVKEKSGII